MPAIGRPTLYRKDGSLNMIGFIALVALILLMHHWQWVLGAYLLIQVVKLFSGAYEMDDGRNKGETWQGLESEWNTRVSTEMERARAKEDALEQAFGEAEAEVKRIIGK